MNSALIKRLRKIATLESEDYGAEPQDHSSWQAADLIERQAAQIAELQEQLDLQIPAGVMAQQMRKIAEQAAQIEMMREALSKIEYLESANGCIMSAGDCSSVATEALSTTPDQALEQFAAKVREQCAQMLLSGSFLHDQSPAKLLSIEAAKAIRAIKELP